MSHKVKKEIKTHERSRPENVKARIVEEKGYKNLRLLGEEVAEFEHGPTACGRAALRCAGLRSARRLRCTKPSD